ncbi:MAG: hypothetical protein OEM29_09075, partial [Thermoplasmata archaeon]|nr:hypothetical protein [Thermoplasmata archaeon]
IPKASIVFLIVSPPPRTTLEAERITVLSNINPLLSQCAETKAAPLEKAIGAEEQRNFKTTKSGLGLGRWRFD